MGRYRGALLYFAFVLSALCPTITRGQSSQAEFQASADIGFRKATVISEGSRLAAEVFVPKDAGDKALPTIVMSHGWGGTAQ
jgi:hypothetical protein